MGTRLGKGALRRMIRPPPGPTFLGLCPRFGSAEADGALRLRPAATGDHAARWAKWPCPRLFLMAAVVASFYYILARVDVADEQGYLRMLQVMKDVKDEDKCQCPRS